MIVIKSFTSVFDGLPPALGAGPLINPLLSLSFYEVSRTTVSTDLAK